MLRLTDFANMGDVVDVACSAVIGDGLVAMYGPRGAARVALVRSRWELGVHERDGVEERVGVIVALGQEKDGKRMTDHIDRWVRFYGSGNNHAMSASTTATDAEEDIRVLAWAGVDQCSICKDSLSFNDFICTQAIIVRGG